MLRCTSRNMQLNQLFAQVSECMGVKAAFCLHPADIEICVTQEWMPGGQDVGHDGNEHGSNS